MSEPAEFTSEWFDESSRAWLANKKKKDNCTYVYICQAINSKGTLCKKPVYKTFSTCRNHITNPSGQANRQETLSQAPSKRPRRTVESRAERGGQGAVYKDEHKHTDSQSQ